MRTSSTSACGARTLRDPRGPPIATTSTFLGPSSPRSHDAPRSNEVHARVELATVALRRLGDTRVPAGPVRPPQPFRRHRRGRGARIRRVSEEEFDGCGEQIHPARRSGVDRTIAWLQRCRGILVRNDMQAANYEGLIQPPRPHLAPQRTPHQPARQSSRMSSQGAGFLSAIEVSRHGRSRCLDECARDRVNAVASGFLGDVESAVGLSQQIVGFDGVGGKHRDPEAGGNRADT